MFKKWLALITAVLMPLFFPIKLSGVEEELDLKITSWHRPDIAVNFETVLMQDSSKIVMILSDGSQWIVRNSNDGEAFRQISSEWQPGDEIRVGSRTPGKYQGRYILKNVRNNTVFLVDLDSIWEDQSKGYLIEKIDENGYAIFTKSGLEWAIGYWGSFDTCKWEKGDRIIINKSTYSRWEDYLLINVDKKTHAWASLINWR